MRKAHAKKAVAGKRRRSGVEEMLDHVFHLHKTLNIEGYFRAVERFIDELRFSLEQEPDPEERNRMRRECEEVIETAVFLVCGPTS